MLKATATLTQVRRIAMALTMTFAATTFVTACGNDDSAGDNQTPETEMNTENENNTPEESTQSVTDDDMEAESEAVAESDGTDTAAQAEETETMAEANETDSASTVEEDDPAEVNEGPETHTVMAQGLKYIPLVITINNGDTVAWRNMPTHNTKSLDGLIPEGAEHWESPINESYERTFTQDGIYVYKCVPHFGAGMGGVVIVGDPVNLEQIKNADAKGAAGRLVRKGIAEAESM